MLCISGPCCSSGCLVLASYWVQSCKISCKIHGGQNGTEQAAHYHKLSLKFGPLSQACHLAGYRVWTLPKYIPSIIECDKLIRISSGSYMSDMITYIVHEVHLLTGDVGAISKGKRGIWCKSCYMTQPDLKEANLDEDQLIILTQVTETWKECSLAFTLLCLP